MASTTSQQFTLTMYSSVLKGALVLAMPLLIFRPKTRAGLGQKFGFIDKGMSQKLAQGKKAIWIHTVSVGEFNGAFPLIESIRAKYPDRTLVISTTTEAGQILAKQRMGNNAQVIYFPFDLSSVVERFLTLINPSLIIIFETELWPNFISACWNKKIPVAILNARISPRSFKRYKFAKWLFAPVLNKLALIGTQSESESQNYKEIGGHKLPTQVLGNLKYDWKPLIDEKACQELKAKLNIAPDDLVIIAGSTHPDEEKVILNTYKSALTALPKSKNIKLIIAPRHPERFNGVSKIIEEVGFRVCRYSKNEAFSNSSEVYLLDTIGQLANFYALANVAFVGGSIANVGGHNLLEPYLYSVPVVCGPNLFKTKETATILSNQNALFIANDSDEVAQRIIELLQSDSLRIKMGSIGKLWLENNRGAVDKSLEAIDILLDANIDKSDFVTRSNDNTATKMVTK